MESKKKGDRKGVSGYTNLKYNGKLPIHLSYIFYGLSSRTHLRYKNKLKRAPRKIKYNAYETILPQIKTVPSLTSIFSAKLFPLELKKTFIVRGGDAEIDYQLNCKVQTTELAISLRQQVPAGAISTGSRRRRPAIYDVGAGDCFALLFWLTGPWHIASISHDILVCVSPERISASLGSSWLCFGRGILVPVLEQIVLHLRELGGEK